MVKEKETKSTTGKKGNREYRSDVFSMLMDIPEYALQVYNALNHTNHTDPEQIEIRKLNKGIYLSIRNDASFVLDSYLNLYEHQSTVCPNMPLRNLIYVVSIWEDLISHRDLFGSRLIKIPAPHFVVFYNGLDKQPDEQILKLSDAYEQHQDRPELELYCRMINIRDGHSPVFLESCQILEEYALFVRNVEDMVKDARESSKDLLSEEDFGSILEKAIDYCISHDILAEFLKKNRMEVLRVTTLDYSFERRIQLSNDEARKDGIAEGKQQGLAEGKQQGLAEGKQQGLAEGEQRGITKGISLISSVVKRLKAGESAAAMLDEGIPAEVVQAATELL